MGGIAGIQYFLLFGTVHGLSMRLFSAGLDANLPITFCGFNTTKAAFSMHSMYLLFQGLQKTSNNLVLLDDMSTATWVRVQQIAAHRSPIM